MVQDSFDLRCFLFGPCRLRLLALSASRELGEVCFLVFVIINGWCSLFRKSCSSYDLIPGDEVFVVVQKVFPQWTGYHGLEPGKGTDLRSR